MPVPTTAYGVAVLLILVIPGIVYAAVRTAVRGHRSHDREAPARVLQALMVSALLDALYLLLFGTWAVDLLSGRGAGLMERPRAIALAVLLLGIGVPAALAYLIHGQIQWRQPNLHYPDKLAFLRRIDLPAKLKFMSRMKLPLRTTTHQPTPTEVISPTSGESAVFEMGENECGFDDVADLAGAGGDVVEGAPAAGE